MACSNSMANAANNFDIAKLNHDNNDGDTALILACQNCMTYVVNKM